MKHKGFITMLVLLFAVMPLLSTAQKANANGAGNAVQVKASLESSALEGNDAVRADSDQDAVSVAGMKALVKQFGNDGEFANDNAVHALKLHLKAVDRFKKQGKTKKVVKHMKGFKVLLEHQKKNGLISEKAYHALKTDANSLIQSMAPFQVSVLPVLRKVLRDEPIASGKRQQILRIDAARNEYEDGQIVIRAGDDPLRKLQVKVSNLKQKEGNAKIDKDHIQLFKQHYIEVTQHTLEKGPYPLGWYPDALIPLDELEGPLKVGANQNQGMTIQVHVPKGQPAGTYTGEVWVHEIGPPVRIPIELTVWDFELSDAGHTQTAFAIWPDQVAKAHGVESGSDEYWELMDKYYWFQTEHRLMPQYLPIPTDDVGRYVKMAGKYLDNPMVNSFRIPFYKNQPGKTKKLVDLLREKGWLFKGYFYLGGLIDEPGPNQYQLVRELSEQLKRIAPDVKNLVTTEPVNELIGYVNTWVPSYNTFAPKVWHERQKAGDHVWWYGSCCTNHPLPSYLIDDDLVGTRLLSWMQRAYNVEGTLYWGTTIFQKWTGSEYIPRDVWTDPLAFPGANGDGYLMYPGNGIGIDGPVGTVRLEAIRDGMEDYEYLWIAEQRMTAAAERLGVGRFSVEEALQPYYNRLFQSIKNYSEDPDLLIKVRRDLAERIVSLSKRPQILTHVETTGPLDRSLHIYTEKGSNVTVNKQSLKLMNQTDQHDEYVFSLHLAPGKHKVDVSVMKNGETKKWTETIVVRKTDASRYKIELNYNETEQDLQRWEDDHVELGLSSKHVTQGNKSLKATYQSDVAFPGFQLLDEGDGFRSKDWSNFVALKFDVHNPNPEKVRTLQVKFFQEGGLSYDSIYKAIRPNETKTIRIPLRNVLLDLTKMRGFTLWMWELKEPATLYFDNFHFVSNKPGDPMTP